MSICLRCFLFLCGIQLATSADIIATAQGTGEHGILAEALTKADLVSTLQGTGPFTVFAPTDDAFAAALTALSITKEELLDRADLADILTYHVLSGNTGSSALQSMQTVTTVNTLPVTITKDADGEVMFASAKVTNPDVVCDNGVIHVIDTVVLPPTVDIVSTAVWTGNHAVLAEALTKANLVSTLQGPGPFTVFAPTDEAFNAALTALNITKQQLLDRADLADILKYHVLEGNTGSSALQSTQTVTTVNTLPVTITKDAGGKVMFASAEVTDPDVVCDNGVIHVIDTVVLPPTVDIVSTALWTGNHAVLAEALTKANLVSTLQGTGPFTVFAPTDAAFTAALAALNITKQQLLDRADLADILTYHVLNGKVLSSDLQASQTPETLLSGQTVTITKSASDVKFADATVTGPDVLASNGVIHVIDKVVLPPGDSAPAPAAPAAPAPSAEPTGDSASGAKKLAVAIAPLAIAGMRMCM